MMHEWAGLVQPWAGLVQPWAAQIPSGLVHGRIGVGPYSTLGRAWA